MLGLLGPLVLSQSLHAQTVHPSQPIGPYTPTPEFLPPLEADAGGGAEDTVARVHTSDARPLGPFGFDDRPVSVNLALGFGMPLGLAGAFVEYSPLPWLAMGAGAGTSFEGLQLAALARVRPLYWETPYRTFAIALAGAIAEGPYSGDDDVGDVGELMGGHDTQYAWLDHALWFQPELQFEYAARSGFHLVVTGIGIAYLLNGSTAECRDYDTNARAPCAPFGGASMPKALPAFTVELGYSLP
jgi:hypothetical protein